MTLYPYYRPRIELNNYKSYSRSISPVLVYNFTIIWSNILYYILPRSRHVQGVNLLKLYNQLTGIINGIPTRVSFTCVYINIYYYIIYGLPVKIIIAYSNLIASYIRNNTISTDTFRSYLIITNLL